MGVGQNPSIQYRQGDEDAVLDFHKVKLPNLKAVQGLTLQGPNTRLGNDGFIVASGNAKVPPAQDNQIVDTTSSRILGTVFDVKQVREEVTNPGTGTTFLLTGSGLFLVRRPAVEWNNWWRQREWFFEHDDG
jgi:hypothetical protein